MLPAFFALAGNATSPTSKPLISGLDGSNIVGLSKLLTLALIVDEQGFAKYSHLFAGNQSECNSLPEMIESLVKTRPDLSTHKP